MREVFHLNGKFTIMIFLWEQTRIYIFFFSDRYPFDHVHGLITLL